MQSILAQCRIKFDEIAVGLFMFAPIPNLKTGYSSSFHNATKTVGLNGCALIALRLFSSYAGSHRAFWEIYVPSL